MLRANGGVQKYYAVRKGQSTGIFKSWDDVKPLVSGFRGAQHKAFHSQQEAAAWLAEAGVHVRFSEVAGPGGAVPAGHWRSDGGQYGAAFYQPPVSMGLARPGNQQHHYNNSRYSHNSNGNRPFNPRAGAGTNGGRGQQQNWQPKQQATSINISINLPAVPAGPIHVNPVQHMPQNGRQPSDADKNVVIQGAVRAGNSAAMTAPPINPQGLYRVEFDGASRGNPGRAGAGAALVDAVTDEELVSATYYLPCASTNNEAEYCGLILGLQMAARMGVQFVVGQGDSQLVVRQVEGRYRVNAPHLVPYHEEVMRLKRGFRSFRMVDVRREFNRRADALSNQAIDGY